MTTTGIVRQTNRYLNDVNDPLAGQSVTGGEEFPGQLGATMVLNAGEALKLSDTAVGTLYAGKYQYVKFLSTQSGTTVVGGPVYWSDADNFLVTADVPTNGAGFAGVAISVPTKGNYAWIQTRGKAKLQCKGTVTASSKAIGDPVQTSTIGAFDDVDGTQTYLIQARRVGQWLEAPADGALKLAVLSAVELG
jgi:hypothetical protein